jgi:16S rRNA (cytidine1402-2'-O)-methyltransferase
MAAGTLYIVPTPIGNLGDITVRALEVLRRVPLILCEDTRRTRVLCDRFGIGARLVSCYGPVEHRRVDGILAHLRGGADAGLVSDGGTPCISDPGYLLVRACVEAGIRVESLPGPSALVTALAGSGLPATRVLFLGFPPKKSGRQLRTLAESRTAGTTIVFYESPRRLGLTLNRALEVFPPDTPCVVARELTKVHEEYVRGTLGELATRYRDAAVKGEVVVLLHCSSGTALSDEENDERAE